MRIASAFGNCGYQSAIGSSSASAPRSIDLKIRAAVNVLVML
jgi:hypothetical protein